MHDETTPSIPAADLIHRRIYRISSRNLIIGAWNAETNGFIGIRQKFSERYLFTEYEYDIAEGTAVALDDLGVDVPSGIDLKEYQASPKGKEWIETYRPLFDLLAEHEPRAIQMANAEGERLQREHEEREAALTPEEKAEREEADHRLQERLRAEREQHKAEREREK